MDWSAVGQRIRTQREYLGYTREQLAEKLEITPKFCSDIELGLKGMSVPTLCKISSILMLSTDYILFGKYAAQEDTSPIGLMLQNCSPSQRVSAEEVLKVFIQAVSQNGLENSPQN